jgi:hypothetical protein
MATSTVTPPSCSSSNELVLSSLSLDNVLNLSSIAEVHEAFRQTQADTDTLSSYLDRCLAGRDYVETRLELIDIVPYVAMPCALHEPPLLIDRLLLVVWVERG